MARMRALRLSDRRVLLAIAAVVAVGVVPATAAAQTPGVGGYAGVAPAVINQTAPPAAPRPAGGVQGVQEESANDQAPAGAAPGRADQRGAQAESRPAAVSTGKLPFTGLQVTLMLLGGLTLLGLGLTLRRTTGPQLPA